MERVKTDKLRFIVISFFLWVTLISMYFYIRSYLSFALLVEIVIVWMIVVIILLITRILDEDIYFSNEGIIFDRKSGKLFIEWKNIEIRDDKRTISKLFPAILICNKLNPNHCEYLSIDYISRKSVIRLLKKYCPEDNVLNGYIASRIPKFKNKYY